MFPKIIVGIFGFAVADLIRTVLLILLRVFYDFCHAFHLTFKDGKFLTVSFGRGGTFCDFLL